MSLVPEPKHGQPEMQLFFISMSHSMNLPQYYPPVLDSKVAAGVNGWEPRTTGAKWRQRWQGFLPFGFFFWLIEEPNGVVPGTATRWRWCHSRERRLLQVPKATRVASMTGQEAGNITSTISTVTTVPRLPKSLQRVLIKKKKKNNST